MTPLVQNIIVLSIVALAAGWLARLLWRAFDAKQSCGCGSKSGCAKISSTLGASRSLRVQPSPDPVTAVPTPRAAPVD